MRTITTCRKDYGQETGRAVMPVTRMMPNAAPLISLFRWSLPVSGGPRIVSRITCLTHRVLSCVANEREAHHIQRRVPSSKLNTGVSQWDRGRLGFRLTKPEGEAVEAARLAGIRWTWR